MDEGGSVTGRDGEKGINHNALLPSPYDPSPPGAKPFA